MGLVVMLTRQDLTGWARNPYLVAAFADKGKQQAMLALLSQWRTVRRSHIGPNVLEASLDQLWRSSERDPRKRYELHAGWIEGALKELDGIDDDITEDNLPQVDRNARSEARRVLFALRNQKIAPIIYPTEDAEISIYFKPQGIPAAVQVRLESGGGATWSSVVPGHDNNGRCENSGELPIGLLTQSLRALSRLSDGD